MTTGEKIQKYRKELGLSQEELGKKLLVSRQTVSLWEKDKTVPTTDNLICLKEIFGVSVDDLLGFDSNEQITETNSPAKKPWIIILLVLGSPIWISLLVAGVAAIFSIYISLWAIIISFWAVFASFIAFSLYGLVAGICFISIGNALIGTALVGAGIVCAGLTVLSFFGCHAVTNGTILLTKKVARCIKNRFVKKENL